MRERQEDTSEEESGNEVSFPTQNVSLPTTEDEPAREQVADVNESATADEVSSQSEDQPTEGRSPYGLRSREVPASINLVEEDDQVYSFVVSGYDDEAIGEAKKTELESLKRFNTFIEVRDAGQSTVSSKWVITPKTVAGKLQYKARLVCRGFEENLSATDSPTVDKSNLRLFSALCPTFGWKPKSLDVKSAFLQSEDLDREVFVKPPRDVKKANCIWLLKKPLYGLGDSPVNWWFTFSTYLREIGMSISKLDKALFYLYTNKLEGVLALHVDDCLWAGTTKFHKLMNLVTKKFVISREESENMRYLGIDLSLTEDGINLSQRDYVISPLNLESCKGRVNLTESEIKDYQRVLGKLNWLGCVTRPDLKFDIFLASQKKPPTVKDAKSLNKTVKRVSDMDHLRYRQLEIQNLRILLYSDASLGNLEDRVKSCKAFVLFLADNKSVSLISWSCKKIDKVCTSTLEAETKALKYGMSYAIALAEQLKELTQLEVPIVCRVDSNQLYTTAYTRKMVADPTLRRDIALIQQNLSEGKITALEWVSTKSMLADSLTKSGANPFALISVLESGNLPDIS